MTTTTRHEFRIDRTKPLAADPGTGHNRWHPDIAPIVWCDPGEEVILETRDAFDGQFPRDVSLNVVAAPNLDRLHRLLAPSINGAEPGDLLDIEILDIEPDSYGYTTQVPGFGFLP
jgi:formamidase